MISFNSATRKGGKEHADSYNQGILQAVKCNFVLNYTYLRMSLPHNQHIAPY